MFTNIFTLTYIMAIVILLLSAVLLAVTITQINLFRKYSEAKRGSDHLRASIIKDEEDILINARVKAQGIFEEAIRGASKMESDAKVSQEKQNDLLDKKLTAVIGEFEKAMEKQLENNIKRFNSISNAFEEEQMTMIREEMEQLKQEKIKRLQEKIFEITKSAASEILGNSMSLGAHEELVEEIINKIVL